MKRIAKELKKSYIVIVGIFLIFIMVSLIQSWKSVYTLNEKSLEHAMFYLVDEINQADHEDFIEIFKNDKSSRNFKSGNKVLSELDVSIKYRDYYYSDFSKLYYNSNKVDKVIFDIDEEAMVLSHKMEYHGEIIEIALLKDVEDDLELFEGIVTSFLSVVVVALVMIGFISRHIIKLVDRSLEGIKMLNESISLDNLDVIKPENEFLEFENIYNSYEVMLKKLDLQNQQQVEFIHSSSHELKTPLFIMSGNLEVLEKYGCDDQEMFLENIKTLKGEVKGMNSLVEKLLFLARPTDYTLDIETFEVSDIVLENIYKLKKVYKDVQVNFEPEFLELDTDQQLFEILFKNILENAIKYSDHKPVDITIKDNLTNMEVTVKDRGVGMTKEQVSQIFNRFYRVDSSRNKNIGGHGLGMSIVKKIVDNLESEIFINSKVGVGTEVLLKIKKN